MTIKSTELTELVFKEELTAQGLADLRAKYPTDVVIDMSDDDEFKKARKIRTERNKLTAAIDDRRKEVTKDLKDHGDALISEVTGIYSTVVDPFETEDKRRKDEAAKKQRELDELLAKQRATIASFDDYVEDAKRSSQEQISGMIDELANIEVDFFHKDIVHEAMDKIKVTTKTLTDILTQKIESDRLKAEAEAAEKARKAAEAAAAEAQRIADEKAAAAKKEAEEAAAEAKRIADAKLAAEEKRNKISERLRNLQMMPLDLMGSPAIDISKKLNSLKNYDVPEEEFGDRHQEALTAKATVILRLEVMLEQAVTMERFAAEQAASQQLSEPVIEPEHQRAQDVPAKQASNPDEVLASMGRASDLLPENQAKKQSAPATLLQDLEAWYFEYSISEDSYLAMTAILANHGVKL